MLIIWDSAGLKLIYTDSAREQVGFVDLADPANPVQVGFLDAVYFVFIMATTIGFAANVMAITVLALLSAGVLTVYFLTYAVTPPPPAEVPVPRPVEGVSPLDPRLR